MIPSPLSPTQRLQLVKMNINELAFRVSGKTINFPDNQKNRSISWWYTNNI